MAKIQDHEYVKICAELASRLSISIASARRKVDLAVAKEGLHGLEAHKELATKLLELADSNPKEGEQSVSSQFDSLLEALASEENFMLED